MQNHTRGRYAVHRKPRNPFYLLAALLLVGLVFAGCGANGEIELVDPEPAALSDDEIAELAFEVTLDSMTASELAEVCTAVDLFGMDGAIDLTAEGYGPDWRESYGPMLAALLRERC